MDKLIGQVLQERYRIHYLLGRQKGRRTFRARDLQTQAVVVVKLLLFGPDFTWDDLKLFEREVEVLKSLAHPTIPQYLDCFEVETENGKGLALVQTYIEARSLLEWVKCGRTFSESDLKAIAKQLLEILDYLHCRQPPVIHRDLKPSNILLGDRSGHHVGTVYLIDFGSVQTVAHGGTATIVGTYGYMPPEQFGSKTTPASDLYALGATLIFLATGQHPEQLPQRSLRIMFAEQARLSQHLSDWLTWLTEPDVDSRAHSAREALDALEQPIRRNHSTVVLRRPVGSKVRITKTSQELEVVIPPQGFHFLLIVIILFALGCDGLLIMFCKATLSNWWSVAGWFMALFEMPFLIGALRLTWSIVFTLFGWSRLCITEQEVILAHEVLGLRYFVRRAARSAITRVERTRFSLRIAPDGEKFIVPSQLKIWAGTKKIQLSGNEFDGGNQHLSGPELDWLAQELSSWLNVPLKNT